MARTMNPLHASSAHHPSPAARAVADLDHALATLTVALGVVGLVLLAVDLTAAGTWFGVAGMATALVAQMISRTRGERWVDMVGLLVAFLAFAIGASQGGLP